MTDTLTLSYEFEHCLPGADGQPFCAAIYDARITVDVWADGDSFSVEEIDLRATRHERGKQIEAWLPAPSYLFDLIRRDSHSFVMREIDRALNAGDIGPHMRALTAAERRREMAGV